MPSPYIAQPPKKSTTCARRPRAFYVAGNAPRLQHMRPGAKGVAAIVIDFRPTGVKVRVEIPQKPHTLRETAAVLRKLIPLGDGHYLNVAGKGNGWP